jgi:cytochrome c
MSLHPNEIQRHLISKVVATRALAILMMFVATVAPAQTPFVPSPEKGLALAQRFCQGCHLIEGNPSPAIPAGILSFRGIANKKGQNVERIMDALIRPHVPMPDLQLTNEEILNIVSYLDELRADPSTPPFLTPTTPLPKSPYPKQS